MIIIIFNDHHNHHQEGPGGLRVLIFCKRLGIFFRGGEIRNSPLSPGMKLVCNNIGGKVVVFLCLTNFPSDLKIRCVDLKKKNRDKIREKKRILIKLVSDKKLAHVIKV